MYILNFDRLFEEHKLNKDNYILCDREQTLDLVKCGFVPIGECDNLYVFLKDELIEIFLKGGDSVCYKI